MKLFNDYWVQKHSLERIKLRGWKKDTKALKDLSKKGKEILPVSPTGRADLQSPAGLPTV